MAYLVIVINSSDSIEQLNSSVQSSTPQDASKKLANYLKAAASGYGPRISSMEITTRDSDVSVSTSGSNSQQKDHKLP